VYARLAEFFSARQDFNKHPVAERCLDAGVDYGVLWTAFFMAFYMAGFLE